MTSMSLFDSMEFSLQSENYLDETFGLSAEILAADLNTDGSILDFGHGFSDGLKPQNQVSTLMGPEDSISDLFQDNYGGKLMQHWTYLFININIILTWPIIIQTRISSVKQI